MGQTVDLQEFVGGFVAESEQLVASATANLLEIERANATGEPLPKAVRDLFRALHTIKGLAGMMGIQPIVEISHAFEHVVRSADQAGGQLAQRAVELGLIAMREIAERVRCVAEQRPVAPSPEPLLDELARIETAGEVRPAAAAIDPAWEQVLSPSERAQLASALDERRAAYAITFAPSEDKSSRGITISSVRSAVAKIAQLIKVVPRATPPSEHAPAGLVFELLVIADAAPAQLAEAAATSLDRVAVIRAATPAPAVVLPESPPDEPIAPLGRSFVRVELSRLDELQDHLSSLVVSRLRLERALAARAASGDALRELREIVELQGRQLRDLRRGILRARMVRVVEVLEPLNLLVRSLTRPGIKEARLDVDVRDTELDKAVADRLLPALVHLVRNAIDHAIEPVAERRKLGKSEAGRVAICCREGSGNLLELSISDDGRGIDREAVARRAGRAAQDDHELLDILTTPGFSTRERATETSGRGIGMDIVRRVTQRELGGELALHTTPGEGTSFTLRIPLTIAILDVFSFECARQAFVVPVATIEEIVELGDHPWIQLPRLADAEAGHPVVALCGRRGRPLPVISLGETLRLIATTTNHPSKALVVRSKGEPIGFAVDRMLGRHEVVVRPIEDALARAPGIAGATDLGDGHPTLLLDLPELLIALDARSPGWREEVRS
jgi:two-component system, chemotaxis family, sensor kinase CheA